MQEQEWRPVKDFPNYEISDHGQLRKTDTGIPIQTSKRGRGRFLCATLHRGKCTATRSLHVIVGEAFLAPLGPKQRYKHISEDVTDNRVGNVTIAAGGCGRPVGAFRKPPPDTYNKTIGRPKGTQKPVKAPAITIAQDRREMAKRALERETERRRAYLEAVEAKRASAAEAAALQVDAYNAAIAARRAERKAALLEQENRKQVVLSDKQWEAELSGWLAKTEAGWQAYKRIDGKARLLGTFKTIGEAARAQEAAGY
jgi:hypothetical protein